MIFKMDNDMIYAHRTESDKSIVYQTTSLLHPTLGIIFIVQTIALSPHQIARYKKD